MLKEDQTAELLLICEGIAGKELCQTRGNLSKAENRAAAIWELLVIEAASHLGEIEYEPRAEGSPDILIHPVQGRPIWIEAAFLYPRFWSKERQSRAVVAWLFEEAKKRGIPPWKIHPRLDGFPTQKGPLRTLPDLHERKKFLLEPEIVRFFQDIVSKPGEGHECVLSAYSVCVSYVPTAQGPYLSGSGLAQEAPKTVKEHAVYRVLKEKAKQHKVEGPHIICVGSDQSSALSPFAGPGLPQARDAIAAAFNEHHSLSAVIAVRIETKAEVFRPLYKQAVREIHANPNADYALTQEEMDALMQMNFNRWKYTFPLGKWESSSMKDTRRVSGTLSMRYRGAGVEIEIPEHIVIGALAGKTNLLKEYQIQDGAIKRALDEGWIIESCSLKKGNIQGGEPSKVVLHLVPPFKAVYRREKGKPKGD